MGLVRVEYLKSQRPIYRKGIFSIPQYIYIPFTISSLFNSLPFTLYFYFNLIFYFVSHLHPFLSLPSLSTMLDGTEFSPEVRARLKTYPIVVDKSVSDKSSTFGPPIKVSVPRKGSLQAVPLPGSKTAGFSAVYRNVHCPDRLISSTHPNVSTVVEAFEACANANKSRECMGERQFNVKTRKWGHFVYETYEKVAANRAALGKGLADVVKEVTGIDSQDTPYCVGLYGPNCVNWLLSDLACQTQSLPSVCLYDTLGPESTEYIVSLTEMPVIVASVAHIPFVLSIKHKLPLLKVIISMNELESPDVYERPGQSKKDVLLAWAKKSDVNLYSFSEIVNRGYASSRPLKLPSAQDVITINFTSGTTGHPKGVIITHANILAGIALAQFQPMFDVAGSNGFLSFLPLAHIYERLTIHSTLCSGIRIGFFHGEVTELLDDIMAYHPTIVAGVPRVWNRIAGAIRASTIEAPGVAGALSRKAFDSKIQKLRSTGDYKHAFWDRLWTNKIRNKLGFDKAQSFVTGSAPMGKENMELIKVALGVEFVQGYGLTETMGGISVNIPNDVSAGSVGPVSVTCEVKLHDLPDYNYSSEDKPFPRGEILIRGPQIFMGYYKNEEATKGSIDEDGWFSSGDVGMIDDQGRLYVIDRVKNFFKLAQGEYVGPERIEALYQSSTSLLAQVFIEGNSLETYLVAVVGVNPDTYVSFLNHRFREHVLPTDLDKIQSTFGRKEVRDAFVQELNKQAKHAQLKGYEKIKNVTLALEPFSVENGTMTPTLKVKRADAARMYSAQIQAMYKEGPVPEAKSRI